MIVFITSLRNPQNSNDYGMVERLLELTLGSVAGQTNGDFEVVVVGNREPGFPLPERVHFLRADFPPPDERNIARTSWEAVVWDKGTKLALGLVAASRFNPDFVMFFDADDFIHRGLAHFVNSRLGDPGWYISHGYTYSGTRNSIARTGDFNHKCGTCVIAPYASYMVPNDLGVDATQDEIARAFGDRLWKVIGAHFHAVDWFIQNGYPLEPLPFRGAVYHVDTGENHSGQAMRGWARPLNAELRAIFGLPAAARQPRLVECYGPRATYYTLRGLLRASFRFIFRSLRRAARR